ncbi:MAG TPA: hypothetical protein VKE94_15885 [Gemmataceae bacterium]|nr:hypothetical protein [Gemmataceae bacterium]
MRTFLSLSAAACLLLAANVRADDDPQKVIEKAIKAHGERAGKGKAAVFKMKGKFYGLGEGIDFTADFKIQEPSQNRMDLTIEVAGEKVEIVQAIDGDKGWKSAAGNAEDLNKDELAEAKENIYAERVNRFVDLREKSYKLSSLGEKKVGDRQAVGVKVSHEGHREISLYFDKEKGLLLVSERRGKDPMTGQEFTQETLYEDYKPIDGVQQAHKTTINRDGKKYVEGDITDFKRLDEIDASTFVKP